MTSLWRHQQEAVDFVLERWDLGLHGAMLSCAMGTGKTLVVIELCQKRHLSPILIISPLRVVDVWRGQFEKHLPGVYDFLSLDKGTVTQKAQLAQQYLKRTTPLAIAINYESSWREPFAHLATTRIWPLVVADESHRAKNNSGAISRFLGRLGMVSRHRLALTGTPMPHSPLDVWAQFRFVDRTIYDPTYTSFRMRYAEMDPIFPSRPRAWKDLDELRRKFFTAAFQVGPEVLDLPAEQDQNFFTEFDAPGADTYSQMEDDFIATLDSGEEVAANNKLTQLLRLQQITSGVLPDERGKIHRLDISKGRLLGDLLEDLAHDEPVVVFCRFRPDLDMVHEIARTLGRRSGEISGDQGHRDDIKAFQRGGPEDPVILAVQIQSGGVGIDLTRAHYGIYFSLGFSMGDYVQSRARLHRPGQKHPVMFYHLFVRDTVDTMVAHALERRQDLVDSVLKDQDLVESVLKELKCSHRLPRPTASDRSTSLLPLSSG